MKRMDRNGDLIMVFLSRLSGGFTNQRFVSLEKKGNVLVKLNRVDEVVTVRRVRVCDSIPIHRHTICYKENVENLSLNPILVPYRYISEHRNTDYKI